VRGFRNHDNIASYRDGEWAERGEITLDATVAIIGVSKMTALRMIRRGYIKGRQVCAGAPWVIKVEDVTAFAVRKQSAPVTSVRLTREESQLVSIVDGLLSRVILRKSV